MFVIDTEGALACALNRLPDPNFKRLLTALFGQLDGQLRGVARFVVVERKDKLDAIEAAVGFPLTIDGAPTWEIARHHPGAWVEIVFVLSDDGPADVLLLPTHDGIDPNLIDLLQRHGALATKPERHAAA